MDEKNYNSDQDKDWNSDYNQKREEESDDFGLPDVSYDPYKKDREQSYDYGQSDSSANQSSDQNQSDDYNQSSDYGQSSGYGSGNDYSSSNDYQSGSYGSSYGNEKKEDQDDYDNNYNDDYQDDYQKDEYEDEYEYDDDPYYDDDEEDTDNTGKVLMIILAILIVAAGLFAGYWFWLKDILYPPEDNVADTEVVDEAAGDDGMTEAETNAVPQDALEESETSEQSTEETGTTSTESTTPSTGGTSSYSSGSTSNAGSSANLSTIQSRTGNYWIVVGSFIDDDMAIDYGKNLANSGTGSFLIYPYGNTQYYRLAIDKASSWGAAENLLNNYRSRYGNDVWILKY